jgi:thiol-disulfide isomerase/thioredoxin
MKSYFRPLLSLVLAVACVAAAAEPIQPFGPDSMQRIMQAHKGKPFVLVVWSLDCEFCRASLDTLAKAKQQRPDLDVVTVSTDRADDPQLGPMMRDRLVKAGMERDAWAYGPLPPERLRYAIDHKWHGEKPRSYWFNAAGDKIAYSGVITETIIEQYFNKGSVR